MTHHRVLSLAAAVAVWSVVTHSQTQRDPAGAPTVVAAGTATVSGVIMSDETPARPVRRATVSLVAADLRVPLSTVTDDSGRFTFSGVAAGHYGVVAAKPAYVGAFYGSKRPGRGPGVPVAVATGARVVGLTLTLTRGGVITGILRLPSGQLAHNFPVSAVEIETVNGVRRLRFTGGRTATNDRGEYRIFGLPAGEYIVQAQPSGLIMGSPTGINDTAQTTAAEVSWAEQTARGRGAMPAAPAPVRGPTVNYAPVFFPGTSNPSGATIVQLGAGEERRGVDFSLALSSTAKISGVVVGPDGQPLANADVTLVADDGGLSLRELLTPRAPVKSGANGSFLLPAVPPGRYQLSARAVAPAPGGAQWAVQEVQVEGREVSGLSLSLQPGFTVSGKLMFESSLLPPPTAEELARARVTVAPATTRTAAADVLASGALSATAQVGADGSFVVSGLAPNMYRLSVAMPGLRTTPTAPPGGWALKSIMLGTTEISDRPLDLQNRRNIDGLVATFTDRTTALSGMLTDQSNKPAPGFPIVVFSANRLDWIPNSRRVVVARPSTDGTFNLIGLPSGKYYLCAVVALDQSDLEDVRFLEQLVPGALTITLTDGAPTIQNLRIAGK